MEWEEVNFGRGSDDPLQISAPESFFDPSLEALDSFPKNLLTDITPFCYNSEFSTVDQIDSSDSKDNADFRDLIDSTFEERFLSDGSISSVLSSDEIFSQIEICSELLAEKKGTEGDNKLSIKTDLSDINCSNFSNVVNSKCSQNEQSKLSVNSLVEADQSSMLLDKNLEQVEFDIAELKKEVDFTCDDDDSMWSDFFSEDDPSEISKEYDDLLKSLLTTPVDDFDLTLNVFNNVDQAEEDAEKVQEGQSSNDVVKDVEAARRKTCIEHILADHCYTLPWEEAAAAAAKAASSAASSALLTPPNSSDDSEPESEVSSHSCSSLRKHLSASNSSKFIHKTVKLKHKKDLKFVFSIKVKDKIAQSQIGTVANTVCQSTSIGRKLQPGRSLLKKNHSRPSAGGVLAVDAMSSSLVREVLQKRAYRKKHKLNEAALAVQSLLGQDGGGRLTAGADDRLNKMRAEREMHNSMERQRRIELKKEYDKLKSLIPDIAHNDKVSKLNVLNFSAEYVLRLEKTDLKLKQKKNNLKTKRQKLMDELSRLNRG